MDTLPTPNPTEGREVARILWTPEYDAILREEWSKGTAARDIAAILTAAGFSQTRNGILGRAHRKGLARHINANTKGRPPKPRPAIIRPDFSKPLAPTGCRYIHGDAAGWQSKWCDAPLADPDGSWCARHRAIVFRPQNIAETAAAAGTYKNKRAA